MSNVVAVVLGGGRGTRLYPLTKFRAKPAVPLAGKYRLIDIPLSNCLNSDINRIYVLTQFLSVSLHRHIRRTYNFDPFSGGFVELLAAQQTNDATDWYQGTADAVRQHLRYLQQPGIDYVLILSGDQLYRMDYRQMLKTHQESNADVTIAALPVDRSQAAGFGIMRLNDEGRVMGFLEKPKTEQELEHVRTDPAWIEARGIPSRGRDCLASMGIYLFNRDKLVDLLSKTDYHDFGKEIFPTSIRTNRVQVHLFDGYWEDIGTIKAFYDSNLQLCQANPEFDMMAAAGAIYTRARFLAASQVSGATIKRSLISDGCTIDEGAVIENSIIGLRCVIGKNVTIRNSIVMGNDMYQMPEEIEADKKTGRPLLGIGAGTLIDGAIIDKNCRVGSNVRIKNDRHVQETPDSDIALIRDGIAIVPKDATVPDNWHF
ncbi:MAG: glucose-1-phosphate adenylyltransferase [Planctomycetes bacterium]|nr:glucose-1-phosphate adenylyltransferase [Planctomycetota bacterium]